MNALMITLIVAGLTVYAVPLFKTRFDFCQVDIMATSPPCALTNQVAGRLLSCGHVWATGRIFRASMRSLDFLP